MVAFSSLYLNRPADAVKHTIQQDAGPGHVWSSRCIGGSPAVISKEPNKQLSL